MKAAITFLTVLASYFVVMWIVTDLWPQAFVIAVQASLVFSTVLLAMGVLVPKSPWKAFWLANLALTIIVGGIELYGFAVVGTTATRFGGARLSVDGHMTLAGLSSVTFDVGICVLSNLLGFSLARSIIFRRKLD